MSAFSLLSRFGAYPFYQLIAYLQLREEQKERVAKTLQQGELLVQAMFECSDRDWIDISRLLIPLNRVLERMEERGDRYRIALLGGRVKIYKKYYCCFGLEVLKNALSPIVLRGLVQTTSNCAHIAYVA